MLYPILINLAVLWIKQDLANYGHTAARTVADPCALVTHRARTARDVQNSWEDLLARHTAETSALETFHEWVSPTAGPMPAASS